MPSKSVKFTPEKPAPEKRSHGLGITIFSAVILVIIVVTFIGAPVVSKVTEQSGVTFGSYDGQPIEFVQGNVFAQQVEQLNRMYEQFNQGTSNLDLQRQLVWRQAFEQTALQIGLEREALLAGIVVTDETLDKQLVTNSNYLKDGKFSEELYRNTSAADRFTFRQEAKTEFLVQQYGLDRTQGPQVSEATKNFIASMAYPQKKFSFVTFTEADYPASALADYAAKNKALFRTIDLSRIVVLTSESEAAKVREEAVKGEKSFAELAKLYSKDTLSESGGALNVRHYYELKADIAKTEDLDKLFGLAKGGISEVIKGDKTWTIYKVNSPATEADLTSADVLAVVKAYIVKNDRGLLEDALEAQAKTFAEGAAADFAKAASAAGKTVGQTGWIAMNFGNYDLFPATSDASKDAVFQGLASNEEFFKKALRLNVGQVSAPILASPSVLVLRADEVKAAAAPGDTPVSVSAVNNTAIQGRRDALQNSILTSPKLKDQFQAEFNRRFTN